MLGIIVSIHCFGLKKREIIHLLSYMSHYQMKQISKTKDLIILQECILDK